MNLDLEDMQISKQSKSKDEIFQLGAQSPRLHEKWKQDKLALYSRHVTSHSLKGSTQGLFRQTNP